jgi:hypothetical protein
MEDGNIPFTSLNQIRLGIISELKGSYTFITGRGAVVLFEVILEDGHLQRRGKSARREGQATDHSKYA